jgi:hypothetical protein
MGDGRSTSQAGSSRNTALSRGSEQHRGRAGAAGRILVNNDAFYRVSDFLKSGHFYEPLHRKIFEVVGELIRMGKIANPVTIKTFLPSDERSAT